MFECPTILSSSLKNHPDQSGQVKYFEQTLAAGAKAYGGWVQVISWDAFEALSKQLDDDVATGKAAGTLPLASGAFSEPKYLVQWLLG